MNAKSYQYDVQTQVGAQAISVPTVDRQSARVIKNAFNAAYGQGAQIVQRTIIEKVIR